MEKLQHPGKTILGVLAFLIYALSGCGVEEQINYTPEQMDSIMASRPKVTRLTDTAVTMYISTEQGLREHKLTWVFKQDVIIMSHVTGNRIFKVLNHNNDEYYATTVNIFDGIVANVSIIRKDNWISVGLTKYYINFDPPISEEPRIVVSTVRTHLVRKGDNYIKLSAKYNVPVDTLKFRNNNKTLQVGQTIRIDE